MTDRAELIARIRQVLPTRPSWTLAEYERAVIAALEATPEPAKPLPESVEEWIAPYVVGNTAIIAVDDLRAYLTTLTAAQDKP